MTDPYREEAPTRPRFPDRIGFIRLPDLTTCPGPAAAAVECALLQLNVWKRVDEVAMVSHRDLPRMSPGSDPTPLALGTFELSNKHHVWFVERVPNDGVIPTLVREPDPQREIALCHDPFWRTR